MNISNLHYSGRTAPDVHGAIFRRRNTLNKLKHSDKRRKGGKARFIRNYRNAVIGRRKHLLRIVDTALA